MRTVAILDGAVHAFDLAVCPRMVGLSEAVFDAVAKASSFEGMTSQHRRGSLAVLGQIGKLNAVVSKHGVDVIRDRFDQIAKELRGCLGGSPLGKLCKSKLGSAINGHKEMELSFGALHFGDVDMEIADRIGFELLLFD